MDESQTINKSLSIQKLPQISEGSPQTDFDSSSSPPALSGSNSAQGLASSDPLDHPAILSCVLDHDIALEKNSETDSCDSEIRLVPRHENRNCGSEILCRDAESQRKNENHARHSAPLRFVIPYAPPELLCLKNVSLEEDSDSSGKASSLKSESSTSEIEYLAKATRKKNSNKYPAEPHVLPKSKLQAYEVESHQSRKVCGKGHYNRRSKQDGNSSNVSVPTEKRLNQSLPGVSGKRMIDQNDSDRVTVAEPGSYQREVQRDVWLDDRKSTLHPENFVRNSKGSAVRMMRPSKTASPISKRSSRKDTFKGLQIESYNKVKNHFILHTGKKGWMICKKCGQNIWAPNCSRHAFFCKAKES